MNLPIDPHRDQAAGLRQMFAHARVRFVPVVSNPFIAFSGIMLERLCAAFAERQANVLVVDAAESAREAGEMALVDLGQCVEPLSERVAYLAARGLPIRFVDARGSTHDFLRSAAEAAPRCDVVLVHAAAPELCRLFSRGPAGAAEPSFPIVLVDDRPSSVTHAYAAMKLLAVRARLVVFDVVLGAAPHSPRAARIVDRLASCADEHFGAVLRYSARIDPAGDASEPASAALRRLSAARLEGGPAVRQTPHLTSAGSHAEPRAC